MKKLTFFILLLLPVKIYAEVLYTEYSEYGEWSEEKEEATDLIYVETEKRYKFYTNERKNIDYFLYGERKDLLADNESYIYTEFSDYSSNQPEELKERIIEEKIIYKYKEIKKVNKIKLSELYGSADCFRVVEIEIKVGKTNINYRSECTMCNRNNLKYLNNKNLTENRFYVINGGSITLDLRGLYNIKDISINLYLYDRTNMNKNYKISFINNDKTYVEYTFNKSFKSEYLKPNLFIYTANSNWIITPEYDEEIEQEEFIEKTYYREVETYKRYKYKDKLYMHFKLEKKYYDESYYRNIEGYIKDEKEYKTFYRKRERKLLKVSSKGTEQIAQKEDKIEYLELSEMETSKKETFLSKLNFKLYLLILLVILLILIIVV